MKYIRSLLGLALLLGLTVVVTANIPESIYAQMNMSGPSAGGVPKSTSGNLTTAPTKTDTFSGNGIISSLVFVTQNPNNTISNGNSATGIKDAKKFVLAGDWVLAVNNGKVTDFTAKFIKVINNGQTWHTNVITHFI